MNPFDWPGPPFLAFYIAFGAALLFLMRHFIHRREAHLEIPRLNLTDPYEIAMLRGDGNEALRVAAISLVDRGLLKVSGDRLSAEEGAGAHVRRPIEKAVLSHFRTPKVAYEMYGSMWLQLECDRYRKDLQAKDLVIGPVGLPRRMPVFLAALALALGVSGIKVAIAVQRERPFGVLILLTLFLVLLLVQGLRKRRTALGDRVMEDLRTLFQHLKTRAHLLKRGGDTNEVALLVAIYGIPALSAEHDYAKLLFPRAAANEGGGGGTSCSTGCGSSCGGGGGGGGCGGCGGGGD